jgi:hypothetical protein
MATVLEYQQRTHDRWLRFLPGHHPTDEAREREAVRRLRVVVTDAAARTLAVTVPGILSTHDAVGYLDRQPVTAEAWRIVTAPQTARTDAFRWSRTALPRR